MLDPLNRILVLRRWFLAVCLAGAVTGCDFPGRPNPADRPERVDQVVDFDRLFQTNCAGCHGADGKLGPAPPLNDAMFLAIIPDAELLRAITEGRPGTPMAAFAHERGGPISAAQVKALAAGLKSHWKSNVELKVALPPYLAADRATSTMSAEIVQRGTKVFARACAACHGDRGQGTRGAGAICDPAFLGLVSNLALRRLIITGRPDVGMPNFADHKGRGADYQPLSSAEIDELVALLGSWRQSPPRATLTANSAAAPQGSIASESQKP